MAGQQLKPGKRVGAKSIASRTPGAFIPLYLRIPLRDFAEFPGSRQRLSASWSMIRMQRPSRDDCSAMALLMRVKKEIRPGPGRFRRVNQAEPVF
jgi:hypothetical protein